MTASFQKAPIGPRANRCPSRLPTKPQSQPCRRKPERSEAPRERTGREACPTHSLTYFFLRTKIEPFTVLKVRSVPPPLIVASTVRSNSTRYLPSEVLFF